MEDEARARQMLDAALAAEAEGHRALIGRQDDAARQRMLEAADRYRDSWEAAPPRAFGRLIGMLKAAVIAGDASDRAAYARGELGDAGDSPPSWYAIGIAALVEGDDDLVRRAADGMREGSEAFRRTADAIVALVDGDENGYAGALRSIVADFEGRDEHLTGVPIADTALMLERIAADRGMAARPESELLPSG
jgi:hypothetical protein